MNADINKPSAAEAAGARSTAPERGMEGGTLPTGDSDRKFARRVDRNTTADGQVEAAPRVPGYLPRRKLGRGTFGEVWLYVEETTGAQVAIKFFVHGTGRQWQTLQAEVKQLALLHGDPGIVQLEDVNAEAVPPYYVMPYAPGGSLADRLHEKKQLPPREALKIFTQVAEALAYVHARGIRHCDLKPSNILLDARGRALIADFGQAHLSSDASPALGTFFYMAPEQAELNKETIPDTRWDVYGLGALLYAMLTGHAPREDETLRQHLAGTEELSHRLERYRAHLKSAPPLREHRQIARVDRMLATILERSLALDPNQRYHDAGGVLAALELRQRQRRQRPLLLFGLVAPLLLLLVVGSVAFVAAQDAIDQSRQHLTQQLLDSNMYTASVVAEVVRRQLNERTDALSEFADRPEVRQALSLSGPERRRQIQELLERKEFMPSGRLFYHIEVVDEQADMLAICYCHQETPQADKDKQANFKDRGWFHGGLDGPRPHCTPIRAPHVSHPYFGRNSQKVTLGISAPIWATPKGNRAGPEARVIGVVLGTVLLEALHGWLTDVPAPADGHPVLIDEYCHCVLHNKDFAECISPKPGERPPVWRRDGYSDILRFSEASKHERHRDPVSGEQCLVGAAPVFLGLEDRKHRWGAALVQHRVETVDKPVRELKTRLADIGWVLLGTVTLLTMGIWGWLMWTIRREERLAHG